MITDEIKFIQTDKEGEALRVIQEDYPNSIIYVKSNKEKNVYIGSERITENYNQVVDKIANLTDDTLSDVYQGMIVYVIEDKSLYILLTDGVERQWEVVGTNKGKLSSPITVAGLSGSFGNVSNGKIYTTENTVEDILRDLLCKEIYPDVTLSTTNPTLSFGGIKGATASNYQNIMEIGSILNLNAVTLGVASISSGSRRGGGFTYGYSSKNDDNKDGDGNPPSKNATTSLAGVYSLSETYSSSIVGTPRSVISSDNCEDVKLPASNIKIGLGNNVISFYASSPSGTYTHPEYPEYYAVSNLGNTDKDKKLSKSSIVNKTLSSITDSKTITVTGVYPVYVNIGSDSLVDEPIKMDLIASDTIVFENVPSEYESQIHFKFDYPATHSVESFEATDPQGKFVSYDATYDSEFETITKVICGESVSYKRLQTTGKLQGEGVYKITLSKSLDK